MKKKIDIFEKIQREILKGFKRIYWFNYTRIKYYTLTLNKLIRQIETNTIKYLCYYHQKKDQINLKG